MLKNLAKRIRETRPSNFFKRAKARHIRTGRIGENAACQLLCEKRYDIILRNYKRSQGEIDIIARDGATLCFIEVKTRHLKSKIRPSENLSQKQKQRIIKSASVYLNEIGSPEVVYRFDLIEVILDQWQVHEIRQWPGHFK